MNKKNRHVGIVGIGETKFSSHWEDVNQPEMIHEAVRAALDDASMTMDDIDCVVHGNMELFEMVHQPDLWHTLGTGAAGRDSFRLTTGGTTGGTLVAAADNLIASGMYDTVLAVGFEKLQEGHTTGGITNMADPLWARKLQSGALTDSAAVKAISEFGEDRARRAAMTYRIIMDKHACLNPNSHRAFGLDWDQMEDLMENSPPLIGDLRLIHMFSQSDGACVMIFASEEKARKITRNPVWIRDHVTVHREETLNLCVNYYPNETTHRFAAKTLYERNGITDPLNYFDVFEMYDPSAWWGADWIRDFFLLEGDEHLKLIEDKEIMLDGSMPINPSGGVLAANPIGATAMVRVAQAARQIRGDAGPHKIQRDVDHAIASSFGGTMWTILFMLEKELNF
ncbi:MAG: hypothetical protein HUN05_02575 [Desulfobacter sp.]|nr:MAG: hypothetical protein HUN05_02575 [Desulfobacter sp.]